MTCQRASPTRMIAVTYSMCCKLACFYRVGIKAICEGLGQIAEDDWASNWMRCIFELVGIQRNSQGEHSNGSLTSLNYCQL
jgi:hypothetical protein